MAATARQIPVTDADLEGGGGGGAFAELEVPGDYEATLVEVKDYDKTSEGKTYGWIFYYDVEVPSGKNVRFQVYLAFSQGARWKLVQVLDAHDVDLEEGMNSVDPNSLVGDTIGSHIDFPRGDDDEPTSKYREMQAFFSLAEEPEGVQEDVASTPAVVEAVKAKAAEGAEMNHDPEVDGPKFGDDPPIL